MTPNYLQQSFFFFRSHFKMLLAIQLPFILALILVKQLLIGDLDAESIGPEVQRYLFLLTGLDLLFVPIYLGATLAYMQSVIEGKNYTVFQSWSVGLSSWLRLFLTFFLSAMAMSIGLMLLIVPGIYIGVRLVLAHAICIIEGKGPMASIKSSWRITEPHFWLLFKSLALIYGLIFMTEMVVAPLFEGDLFGSVIAQVLLDVFNIFATIFGFRIYRAWRDGELAKLED